MSRGAKRAGNNVGIPNILSVFNRRPLTETPLTWLANVMCSRPGSTWCTQPYNVLINDENIRRPGRLSTAEMTFGPALCVDGADGDVVSIIGRQRLRMTIAVVST